MVGEEVGKRSGFVLAQRPVSLDSLAHVHIRTSGNISPAASQESSIPSTSEHVVPYEGNLPIYG